MEKLTEAAVMGEKQVGPERKGKSVEDGGYE